MVKAKDLKKNTYYWVKMDELNMNSHLPILFNVSGDWKVELFNSSVFINTATLQKFYGKKCIVREVNFDKDTVDNIKFFFDRDNKKIQKYKKDPFALRPFISYSDLDKEKKNPHVRMCNILVESMGYGSFPIADEDENETRKFLAFTDNGDYDID